MIKIEFSGLTFFPSADFVDSTNVDHRIISIDNDIVQASAQWNGTTKVVQSIFYDAFKLTFHVRENKKNGFSKIAYAPIITVTNTETSKIINAKFLDVRFERVADNLEFYKCVFSFADLDSKTVQDNYNFDSKYFVLFENEPESTDLQITTDFKPLLSYSFSNNIKSDFNDFIVDYNKTRKKLSVLVFVPERDIPDFFLALKDVAIPSSKYKIKVTDGVSAMGTFGQVMVAKNEAFGEGLFQIQLDLIYNTVITANYN